MRRLSVVEDVKELDFAAAKRLAEGIGEALLGDDCVCLSWYDGLSERESPAHVSECHDGCEVPGYVEYAETRGAELWVDINRGTFSFLFRPLGEFSEA